MKRSRFTAAAVAAICALSVSCSREAVEKEPSAEQAAAEKLSPAKELERRFQEFPLQVGDPFPEADIYDATGKPFNTKSLKGRYTVIVNGCLT